MVHEMGLGNKEQLISPKVVLILQGAGLVGLEWGKGCSPWIFIITGSQISDVSKGIWGKIWNLSPRYQWNSRRGHRRAFIYQRRAERRARGEHKSIGMALALLPHSPAPLPALCLPSPDCICIPLPPHHALTTLISCSP